MLTVIDRSGFAFPAVGSMPKHGSAKCNTISIASQPNLVSLAALGSLRHRRIYSSTTSSNSHSTTSSRRPNSGSPTSRAWRLAQGALMPRYTQTVAKSLISSVRSAISSVAVCAKQKPTAGRPAKRPPAGGSHMHQASIESMSAYLKTSCVAAVAVSESSYSSDPFYLASHIANTAQVASISSKRTGAIT